MKNISFPLPRTQSLARKVTAPSSMMVHAWQASTSAQAKSMWTMAISQHQFYLDKKQAEVSYRVSEKSFTAGGVCPR